MSDFGLLVDFIRGELDSQQTALIRRRLEAEPDLFAQFERLTRTFSVIRSLPAPNAASVMPPQVSPTAELPLVQPRPEFVAALRREYAARGWSALIPSLAVTPEFAASLRRGFQVRGWVARLPLLSPSVAWVAALRGEFSVRAVVSSLPAMGARAAFQAQLRVEFGVRALVGSLPLITVREAFVRRLKVAFYEAAVEPAAPRVSLPLIEPSDRFRRRLFNAIASAARRPLRARPTRELASLTINTGRSLWAAVKRSKSLGVTGAAHILAIVLALFVTSQQVVTGSGLTLENLSFDHAPAPVMNSGPELNGDPGFSGERAVVSRAGENDPNPGMGGSEEAPDSGGEGDGPSPYEVPPQEVEGPRPELPRESVLPSRADAARSDFAMFRLRGESRQKKIGYLGSTELYDALSRSLQYLQRYQRHDGRWIIEGVDPALIPQDSNLRLIREVELTASAALAFLGDGHSSRASELGFELNVKRAIDWLLLQQQPDGQIGPDENDVVLCHSIALLALIEEFALTGRNDLRRPIRQGCRWLAESRATEDRGAFPYRRGQGPSLMTSVWSYITLETARVVRVPDVDAPQSRLDELLRWFDAETTRKELLADQLDALNGDLIPSAAALALTYFPHEGTYEMRRRQLLARMERERPELVHRAGRDDAACDMRYLFFGNLAHTLASPDDGKLGVWEQAFSQTLIKHQIKDGPRAGTFELTGYYASFYGSSYQAAMAALAIENAYRLNLLRQLRD